jgi:hypothetical protein
MTEEGLRRTFQERSMWLWSRSREEFWMAGRKSNGYDLQALRANCMGDSLLAIVDATDRAVCHLGRRSCLSRFRRSEGATHATHKTHETVWHSWCLGSVWAIVWETNLLWTR